MSAENIRRVAIAVLVSSVLSVPAGSCDSATLSERAKNASVTPLELSPPLQSMAPVEAAGPTAAPVQPSNQAVPLMLQSPEEPQQFRSMTTDQKYGPEVVELCSTGVDRASDVQFALKRFCAGATTDGTKDLSRILVKCVLGANSDDDASKAAKTRYPCTAVLEVLKMEAAHPDLLRVRGFINRSTADEQLRSKYQQALQSIPSTTTDRVLLNSMLKNTIAKVLRTYQDFRMSVSYAERTTEDLDKLKAMVAEVRSTVSATEKLKLESVLMEKEAHLKEMHMRCKRYRDELIILVGTAAVTKLDESMKPEVKHVI